jgi:hypothetical protein
VPKPYPAEFRRDVIAVARKSDLPDEEPRRVLDLVAGLADRDGACQQRRGLVVDLPRNGSLARAGARYRSIVTGLIASSSARTSGE